MKVDTIEKRRKSKHIQKKLSKKIVEIFAITDLAHRKYLNKISDMIPGKYEGNAMKNQSKYLKSKALK